MDSKYQIFSSVLQGDRKSVGKTLEKYWGIMLQSKEIYNKLQTSRKKKMAGVILREKIYGIVQNDHNRLPVGFYKKL
jgi:hypothetical protein